jgi:hypothetical protein
MWIYSPRWFAQVLDPRTDRKESLEESVPAHRAKTSLQMQLRLTRDREGAPENPDNKPLEKEPRRRVGSHFSLVNR